MGALGLTGYSLGLSRGRRWRTASPIVALAVLGSLARASIVAALVPIVAAKPMTFVFVREGPAEACGQKCREWISASGQVTTDTRRAFEDLAKGRDLRGAVLVLDLPGGDVPVGIWLGREIRRLGMATTVGKTELLPPDKSGERRAALSASARCASICPFIFLGGVRRHVPRGANILVHQLWPKALTINPAATPPYSARDWAIEQHALGVLARYTVDMGGDIALFETAMSFPPWEPMHALSSVEITRFWLDNTANVFDKQAVKVASPKPLAPPSALRVSPAIDDGNVSSWQRLERASVPVLARQYPLTLQGEEIGQFEISFARGTKGDYKVTYSERRQSRMKRLSG